MKTTYGGTAECGEKVYQEWLELSRVAVERIERGELPEDQANTVVDDHIRAIGFEGTCQEAAHVQALINHLQELQQHIACGLRTVFPEAVGALERQAEEEAQESLKSHARGISQALAEVLGGGAARMVILEVEDDAKVGGTH